MLGSTKTQKLKLEAFAKKEFGVDIDRRLSLKELKKQISDLKKAKIAKIKAEKIKPNLDTPPKPQTPKKTESKGVKLKTALKGGGKVTRPNLDGVVFEVETGPRKKGLVLRGKDGRNRMFVETKADKEANWVKA